MTKAEISALQSRIGATPDGFWGPRSIAACQTYLRGLMPVPNPWPKSDQKSLTAFYGAAGDESKLVNLKVEGLGLIYGGKPVRTVRCHQKIADALHRVFVALSKFPEGQKALSEYAGCYNNRRMRGGLSPSLHARGAAVDLSPDSNRNKQSWPTSATMPISVIECWCVEGFLPAGPFWSRDAMHFQGTQ